MKSRRRARKFTLTSDSTYREIRNARKDALLRECFPDACIRRSKTRTTKKRLITVALDQRNFLRSLGY